MFRQVNPAKYVKYWFKSGREDVIMKLSTKMIKALDFMGEPYEIKDIDFERCLYRDLHSGFDVEVSGINHARKGKVCNYIAVWDVSNGKNYSARTVEYVRDVKTLPELKAVLDQLCEKYGSKHLGKY